VAKSLSLRGNKVYVRQLATNRGHRHGGWGRFATALFLELWCELRARVMLDVLESNTATHAFRGNAGFIPNATIMELTVPGYRLPKLN
jgi:hypothetical protein